VWVVKRKSAVEWFASQLDQVVRDVEALRNKGHNIVVDISIYITCDDALMSGQSSIIGDYPQPSRGEMSSRESSLDEKKAITENVEETLVRVSSSSIKECCCTRVITDENAITSPCNCASTSRRPQRESSSTANSFEKPNRVVDARINLLSGRPHVPSIIRKTAEVALGETAVVVCGPPGLVQCTRNAVVAISDDWAVHKGTGAQGIYFHAEAFGYA
jgi:Ferric reductase NAD binding domain